MKFSSACISVALVALAVSVIPAEGADWNNGAGGIKDHGSGAIAVPAPIPYQESYRYYFRADLGLSWQGAPSMTQSGVNYGAGDLVAPLSMNSFAQVEHSKSLAFPATLGAGLYISDRWRADLTVDMRRKTTTRLQGAYSYVADNDAGLAAGGAATGLTSTGLTVGPTATAADSSTVSGFAQESLSNRATVLMANFYYDFGQRAKFTPYVGFGVGFAHNRFESEHVTLTETITPPGGVPCAPPGCRDGASGYAKGTNIGFAAALMAGVSYQMTTSTVLDLNYRAQYLQGFDVTKPVANLGAGTVGGTSRVSIGDSWDHQLRAGVRMHVW